MGIHSFTEKNQGFLIVHINTSQTYLLLLLSGCKKTKAPRGAKCISPAWSKAERGENSGILISRRGATGKPFGIKSYGLPCSLSDCKGPESGGGPDTVPFAPAGANRSNAISPGFRETLHRRANTFRASRRFGDKNKSSAILTRIKPGLWRMGRCLCR